MFNGAFNAYKSKINKVATDGNDITSNVSKLQTYFFISKR